MNKLAVVLFISLLLKGYPAIRIVLVVATIPYHFEYPISSNKRLYVKRLTSKHINNNSFYRAIANTNLEFCPRMRIFKKNPRDTENCVGKILQYFLVMRPTMIFLQIIYLLDQLSVCLRYPCTVFIVE